MQKNQKKFEKLPGMTRRAILALPFAAAVTVKAEQPVDFVQFSEGVSWSEPVRGNILADDGLIWPVPAFEPVAWPENRLHHRNSGLRLIEELLGEYDA